MNAKLKPRKQIRSKPSRTGRRAAKASSTVGRPEELKVLNLTYKVIFSSQEEMIGSGAMGFCSVDAQLIALAEDQANDAMQDTFLHEVMHALIAAFDLKEKDKEESFVRRLATGICTVWNDNPKAFKWWRELWFSCLRLSILQLSWLRVCGGGRRLLFLLSLYLQIRLLVQNLQRSLVLFYSPNQ